MIKKRKAKKAAAKKTTKRRSKKRAYNQQTGQLTGRARPAQERLEALTQQYMQDGMDAASARQRARDDMRDNPKMDWRRG
jgi:hypothetical protein